MRVVEAALRFEIDPLEFLEKGVEPSDSLGIFRDIPGSNVGPRRA
jgi:hypothetical protein